MEIRARTKRRIQKITVDRRRNLYATDIFRNIYRGIYREDRWIIQKSPIESQVQRHAFEVYYGDATRPGVFSP